MGLKELRLNTGLSQAELARISGINLRSLQDYEQGHKKIASAKGETIFRLSVALGISMNDVLTADFDICDSVQKDIMEKIQSERLHTYTNMFLNTNNQLYHFPVIINDEKFDMSYIYPTKQHMVKNVLDTLRKDDRVKTLRLFGSSISMRCHKDSDLDFAIMASDNTNKTKNELSEKIQECCNYIADILWLDRLSNNERIYSEIMKGVQLI